MHVGDRRVLAGEGDVPGFDERVDNVHPAEQPPTLVDQFHNLRSRAV